MYREPKLPYLEWGFIGHPKKVVVNSEAASFEANGLMTVIANKTYARLLRDYSQDDEGELFRGMFHTALRCDLMRFVIDGVLIEFDGKTRVNISRLHKVLANEHIEEPQPLASEEL